jgi:hypothetical protein
MYLTFHSSLSYTQGKVYSARLKYTTGTKIVGVSGGFGGMMKYIPYENLKKLPKFEGKALYTRIRLGNESDNMFSVAVDVCDKTEKIYIDFNNDNDLTNDNYIRFRRDRIDKSTGKKITSNNTIVHFTYYIIENGKRKKQEINLEMERSTSDSSRLKYFNPDIIKRQKELQLELLEDLFWQVRSYRTGTIKLKDGEYKLALSESSSDGMYTESDNFIIDSNCDKKFDITYDYYEPINTKIFIANGVIYRIKNVSLSGDYIEIEEAPDTPVETMPFAVGFPVPLFEKEDIYGKKISLADYKGKIVLLRFTSTTL